jgi:hypothetical protein
MKELKLWVDIMDALKYFNGQPFNCWEERKKWGLILPRINQITVNSDDWIVKKVDVFDHCMYFEPKKSSKKL